MAQKYEIRRKEKERKNYFGFLHAYFSIFLYSGRPRCGCNDDSDPPVGRALLLQVQTPLREEGGGGGGRGERRGRYGRLKSFFFFPIEFLIVIFLLPPDEKHQLEADLRLVPQSESSQKLLNGCQQREREKLDSVFKGDDDNKV